MREIRDFKGFFVLLHQKERICYGKEETVSMNS